VPSQQSAKLPLRYRGGWCNRAAAWPAFL